jgi:ubiquinone/menaquinone biosynthesis C-methylase UbiE
VRFPDGQGRMRIRCTRERIFADLITDPRLAAYKNALPRLRPGMRALEIGCGTGSGSARIAAAVGPSGGVVALDQDRESIRFARRRHRFDHLAFEIGSTETLRGELDSAFDAAFVHANDAMTEADLKEVWRCVVPGGWMLLHESRPSELPPCQAALRQLAGIKIPSPGVFIYDRDPEKPAPRRGAS